jgi:hexosaminidase
MKLLLLSILICQVAAIWPAPQSLTNGTSAVWLRDDFRVTYNGKNVRVFPNIPVTVDSEKYHYDLETEEILEQQVRRNLAIRGSGGGHGGGGAEGGSITSEDIVKEAVRRARDVIFAENFIPWKFHPRNEMNKYEPPAQGSAKTYLKTLQITQTGADNSSTFRPLAGQVDESYELKVAADGSASITAVSAIGVLHALQTFTQLWYTHSSGRSIYTNLAPLAIKDAPKFQHRGLNMDVSRNWMPKENILRMIDALAWNKFNRFHIHMTDAQSWPMDIPAMPELSQKGAYQTGLSYSPRDVEEIQLYAQYRGVEAYIEFDMPGHTSSIAFSHPELITAFRATPWEQYCAEPPCGALKLNSPAVYDFLKKLWSDVLPRVSPFTAYFHTGGDELNKLDYTLDETVNSGDAAVITPFLQKLVDFNHDAVRKNGLTPIVWEEMLLDWKLNLGKDVVVQTWIDDEALAKSTALGYKSLFGNYNFWVSHPQYDCT